jgi:hypothetical protein
MEITLGSPADQSDGQEAARPHFHGGTCILYRSRTRLSRRQSNPLLNGSGRSKTLSKRYRRLVEPLNWCLSFSGPTMIRQYEKRDFRRETEADKAGDPGTLNGL